MDEFETDGLGSIITKPVTGWILAPIADSVVLLQIQYVQTPVEFGDNENRVFQFSLMPQQALELAEALTKQAQSLLTGKALPGT
jgi:hypothetical protein